MASASEYANWIVSNPDKKGTPEFDTVARAYQAARQAAPAASPPAQDMSIPDRLMRQVGLTGRAALEGIGGALSLPGTIADAATGLVDATHILPSALPKFNSQRTLSDIGDYLGLPTPQGTMENIGTGGARAMAGVAVPAGLSAALVSKTPDAIGRTAKALMEQIATKPATQIASGLGAGTAGETAKAAGVGPLGQFGSELAGSVLGPLATKGVVATGTTIKDIGNVLGASIDRPNSVDAIARAVIRNSANGQTSDIRNALANRQNDIPGYEPTVGQAIGEANLASPDKQFGGRVARIERDLLGAKNAEDILPTNTKIQQKAIGSFVRDVKDSAAPLRESSLAQANQSGALSVNDIVSKIESISSQPGKRASDIVQKTMGDVATKLRTLGGESGNVDAQDLYTVRKEVGNLIQRHAKDTQNWDKRLSAGLEKDVQTAIDDAITSSGGTGWKDYLSTYSSGMKKVENAMASQKAASDIARKVKGGSIEDLSAGEVPSIPNLLSRPAMVANFMLKMTGKTAAPHVTKRLAELYTNPSDYLQFLSNPVTDNLVPGSADAVRNAMIVNALMGQQRK